MLREASDPDVTREPLRSTASAARALPESSPAETCETMSGDQFAA